MYFSHSAISFLVLSLNTSSDDKLAKVNNQKEYYQHSLGRLGLAAYLFYNLVGIHECSSVSSQKQQLLWQLVYSFEKH